MASASVNDSATSLIHEGWDHLRSQRPLAAWASWQRALRVNPESMAAAEAISTLESARDLPASARTAYRFREPRDPARRAVWNDRMGECSLDQLDSAGALFGQLTAIDPFDAAAWYNKALCLAWAGANSAAIGCLERVVDLEAATAFDDAVSAWTLAEVLRAGGGAETLADDLRFACTIGWDPDDTASLLREFPEIRQVATPRAPGASNEGDAEIAVFEWLDRPIRPPDSEETSASEIPKVLASVFITGNSLRLSSLLALNLERIEEQLFPRLEHGPESVRREAMPLPLAFLDADLWMFRLSNELDPALADELTRSAIEHYFENEWIHRKRKGLGDRSPLEAGRDAGRGDSIARAKLTAVVRLREQLGRRVSTRALYKGYPFDRLRRRLGLEVEDSAAVDPLDLGCADPAELDRLDAALLDDMRLCDAAASAAGLRDDTRTARFTALLLHRQVREARATDWKALVSAVVREAMSRDDPEAALGFIEEALPLAAGETALTLYVWRAEILAREGRAEAAIEAYFELLEQEGARAPLALDAAAFMIDNGHALEATPLLTAARDRARRAGLSWTERRASRLLDRLDADLL